MCQKKVTLTIFVLEQNTDSIPLSHTAVSDAFSLANPINFCLFRCFSFLLMNKTLCFLLANKILCYNVTADCRLIPHSIFPPLLSQDNWNWLNQPLVFIMYHNFLLLLCNEKFVRLIFVITRKKSNCREQLKKTTISSFYNPKYTLRHSNLWIMY